MTFELPAALLVNYALLLLRMSALTLFVPFPGARRGLAASRIALAVALAALLSPLAHTQLDPAWMSGGAAAWSLLALCASEMTLGAAIGCTVRLLLESFGLAAQALGFQAGYSYVNMVDPTSEVDASILNVLLALLASLLFLALDLHLFLVKALAESLRAAPLGSFVTRPLHADLMVKLGGAMFTTALRLALPVMALLLLIDLTLGLLNQVHSRMQLLTLSFTLKIVAATAALYAVLPLSVKVYRGLAESAAELLVTLLEVR